MPSSLASTAAATATPSRPAADLPTADLSTAADLIAAAARIAGQAVRTPLLPLPDLERRLGARVFVKPEVLQRTGSFKFRGAYNTIASLAPEVRAKGVLAFSSGNHAQGVAAAAQIFGIPATILMPADAPRSKLDNTRGYGAEVLTFDRATGDREALAEQALTDRPGRTLVRPFDDPRIIAGQGTAGLEIVDDLAAAGLSPDLLLTCCGGGGLTAGLALAMEARAPECRVHPVEPADFDDTARSLASGERQGNPPGGHSFCDALLSAAPGELTFAINSRLAGEGLTVSDEEVAGAMAYAFRQLKLVVEPGGAVALAALLSGRVDAAGRTVVVMLSGGNVDWPVFRDALERAGG